MSLVQPVGWWAVGPALALAVAGVVVLLQDLVVAPARRAWTVPVALAGVGTALGIAVALAAGGPRRTFCSPQGCSYVADGFTAYVSVLVVLALAVVLLLVRPALARGEIPAGETCALLLWSGTGMVVLAASRDLLTLILALEVVSLPAFVLVGLRRRNPRGAEAAVKFFLVSIVSTAITLYGAALLYGLTGSLYFSRIAVALGDVRTGAHSRAALAAIAGVLVVVGFAFKVAAVPFHAWAPDTYEGAPLPVAAFLSVASKAAGLAGLVLVLQIALAPYASVWGPVVAVLATASMTVGNVVALRQWQVVRLLAWSTVAQAGYLLAPIAIAATRAGRSGTGPYDATRATLVYLGLYAAANAGAFACAHSLTTGRPGRRIADLRGVARTRPLTSAAFVVCLTALAGLPPGVAGLFAKVAILRAVVDGHLNWLAVVVVLNTVVGLAYYLRLAATPFLGLDESRGAQDAELPAVRPSRWPLAAVGLATALTLALSVDPQPVLTWAATAAGSVTSAP